MKLYENIRDEIQGDLDCLQYGTYTISEFVWYMIQAIRRGLTRKEEVA